MIMMMMMILYATFHRLICAFKSSTQQLKEIVRVRPSILGALSFACEVPGSIDASTCACW